MKKELKKLWALITRNIKLYFKDKGTFFSSLISPLILIVLFLTFLGNTYENALLSGLPEGVEFDNNLVKAFTGGWLFSSILATSCVTVSFCSNMMVSDKITGAHLDYQITPVKKSTTQISYTISNFLTTFIICLIAFLISIIYLSSFGLYLSFVDVLMILLDIILTILIGTLIASIIGLFVSSQGTLSAVCVLVSSMYGFLCGAYMPISQLSSSIQNVISFNPGTYSSILFRNYYMRGVINEMGKTLPEETISSLSESFDASFKFFGTTVPNYVMFLILGCTVLVIFALYITLATLKIKKNKISK